ncbi:phage shock protein C (PspC) family protein [Jatrophihabitans endophyticus]|uniref:Phage shock protein C (PspC) family protein n=1 Tax=Jatrophihabitans endophyticus TaxID=1206085 RepID=A0A1M5GE86_9ACTN|nr:PspC domain-containing protein [Jatrophihabitans endophyticus]SHG02047.1 phage shock protein C (PspC) family protein [Jatrophihabitans endophyticus]
MTTTDVPETPTTPPSGRVLRRSRAGRVGAGVAGGLGEYFGVDPVLFRVLFATSAFFGGAGILAYLLAWAAIPEQGTARAPIDGMLAELRRRRVPPWAVAVAIGLLVWAVAFSWWAPGPFVPVVAVVVVIVVLFGRRDLQGRSAAAPVAPAGADPAAGATVDLTKHVTAGAAAPASPATPTTPTTPPATPMSPSTPTWVGDVRSWWDESREASRRRRRRALPVKIAALGGLAASLVVLGIVDAASGIALPVYFWTALGFVGAGLLVGAALRRAPWSIAALLPVTVAGLVAFAGSHASLHDGAGDRVWRPTDVPVREYRLAFGQGVLDLRSLPAQTTARTVRVTAAAGRIRVLLPRTANVEVVANVHLGRVSTPDDGRRDGYYDDDVEGVGLRQSVLPPAGATGARTTVDVHLADGQVDVIRD